jgi:hypothetical protein
MPGLPYTVSPPDLAVCLLDLHSPTDKLLVSKPAVATWPRSTAQHMVKSGSHNRQPCYLLVVSYPKNATHSRLAYRISTTNFNQEQTPGTHLEPTSKYFSNCILPKSCELEFASAAPLNHSCTPVEASNLDYSMPRFVSAICLAVQSRLPFVTNGHLTGPTQRTGSNTRAGYRVHRTMCMQPKQAVA